MATIPWAIEEVKIGVMKASVNLPELGDVTDELSLSDYPDKTIHISGGTVSVLGDNGIGTPQPLHRVDDPTLTLSAVATELLATIIENPEVIVATSSGEGELDVDITIIAKQNKD